MRLLGLVIVFLVLMALQVMAAREAFASSQGGAQVQLKASRPLYYLGLQ
jgi:hypothetical protein